MGIATFYPGQGVPVFKNNNSDTGQRFRHFVEIYEKYPNVLCRKENEDYGSGITPLYFNQSMKLF